MGLAVDILRLLHRRLRSGLSPPPCSSIGRGDLRKIFRCSSVKCPGSSEYILHAARLSGERLLALWAALPGLDCDAIAAQSR
jgi:hypothetical protein